jgi:hypothetical protein
MFGSSPAASVQLVVSDMDATILSARAPASATATVVQVLVGGEANATFAYTSPGAAALCLTPVCEVDAVGGSALTLRVQGIGEVSQEVLTCKVDDATAVISRVSSAGPGLYDVVVQVPPASRTLAEPLTTAFMSLLSSATNGTIYADVLYRSPPRALSAEFSADGSRIAITFDQPTDGQGTATSCESFIEAVPAEALQRPTCIWDVEGRTLSVMLGQGSTIGVGDQVLLLPGVVRSLNGVSSPNLRRSGGGQSLTVAASSVLAPPR